MIIKNYVQSMGGYMIKIENFDNVISSGITYGGHSGSKKGIVFNNEKWFLKYPKSTSNMNVSGLSYTTSPISEYLGSHIYEIIGINTHETKLGYANNKIVIACKDFLNDDEVILDYNSIKNDYDDVVESKLEKLSSSKSNHGTDLEEVLIVMENNKYFRNVKNFKETFWKMFIIDAFIFNNDRNAGNWGLILNRKIREYKITPVYDNGASFYSKSSDEKMRGILGDDHKMKQAFYDSAICAFNEDGKIINPLKYIESMKNIECNKALMELFPKIDMIKIKDMFESIPNEYNGLTVLSKTQKEFYYQSLVYKYEKVLKPIYNKLLEKK